MPAPAAAARTARASGCLEYRSRAATSVSTSRWSNPCATSCSVSFGSPYVSVPVLSKIAVRQPAIRSNATGLFTMIARRAHNEIDPMMAIGIAMSSGHGVAITRTARNRTASPLAAHAARATASATGV